MTMTDPVADFCTRIRNAISRRKNWVDIPSSTLKKRIIYVLKEEHFIQDFVLINEKVGQTIRVFLSYDNNGEPVIQHIKTVSTPGRRMYSASSKIPKVLGGLGISILTTSKGVISNRMAHKLNVGGEVLCQLW